MLLADNRLVPRIVSDHTMKFCNVHAELIALFQHPSSSVFDKGVKSRSELVHATAQVVESEVDAG